MTTINAFFEGLEVTLAEVSYVFDVEVEVTADLLYEPACLGGLPENSSPAVYEIRDPCYKITKIYGEDGEEIVLSPEEHAQLEAALAAISPDFDDELWAAYFDDLYSADET